MSVKKKVIKHIHKHKNIFIIVTVIFIAIITVLILSQIISVKKPIKTVKKSVFTSEAKVVGGTDAERTEASPSSGQLMYEQQETYYSEGSKTPKFIYVTSEYRDDRLIALNDQVVIDLKNTKQINDNTKSYSINYFNNKAIANSYFSKINDPNTSDNDKATLMSGYIAKTTYSVNPKINQIIKMTTAKILKTYL